MDKVCELLGFKLSPYLSIEAYLYCKGGAAQHGEGPFNAVKLHEWLHKREILISPTKKAEAEMRDKKMTLDTSLQNLQKFKHRLRLSPKGRDNMNLPRLAAQQRQNNRHTMN